MKVKLTTSDIDSITEVAAVVMGKVKSSGINFRGTSKIIIATSIMIALCAISCVAYYFVTHHIAPLMIFIAIMLPILCYGLGAQSKTLDSLYKEFDEFADAAGRVISMLGASPDEGKMDSYTKAIAAILYVSQVENVPVEKMTLGQLKDFATYKQAVAYAEHLCVVDDVVRELQDEGLDVNEIFKKLGNQKFDDLAEEVGSVNTIDLVVPKDADEDLDVLA